jgi:hypothetical protein
MGVRWAPELRVEFEMGDGSENQAEGRLKPTVGKCERFFEGGPPGIAKTDVKRGFVKVATVRQGVDCLGLLFNRIRIQAQRPGGGTTPPATCHKAPEHDAP